mmetsp:Transcript_20139/g.50297  ORF Transcript_20139/g.50297 Transcript_20139/m.50297 type:complete len:325 (-) Transcript_20139:375-1349(-)
MAIAVAAAVAESRRTSESYSQLATPRGENGAHDEVEAGLPASPAAGLTGRLPGTRLRAAAAVAAAAAALLLAGSVAVMAARGGDRGSSLTAETPVGAGILELFRAPYEDPQGHMMCPASFTNRGQCQCNCDWAANGGCSRRDDDKTCCFSCCCSEALRGGEAGAAHVVRSGRGFDDVVYSSDAFQRGQPVQTVYHVHHIDADEKATRSYRVGDQPAQSVGQARYTDTAVDNHAKSGYFVGESVFAKTSDGKLVPAVITEVRPDGQYSIRYLPQTGHGDAAVAGQTMASGLTSIGGVHFQPMWVVVSIVFVALLGLGIYYCLNKK